MKQLSTLGRRRREARRQFIWNAARLLIVATLLVLFAVAGYQAGISQNRHEGERQAADLVAAAARNLELTERLAMAEDRAGRLETQLQALRLDYAANVPPADFKPLLAQLQARVRAGVDRERLAFVIEQAGREQTCERGVQTERLLVRTPVSTALENSVSFADRRITVSGDGRPARDEAGSPLDWYDPGQPVTLRFLTIAGDLSRVVGRLPLVHSVILGDREWRFQATASREPGRIEVVAQSCDYP